MEFLGFIYFLYGMYFAGKHFPFSMNAETKDDITCALVLAPFIVVLWPVALGLIANKNFKDNKKVSE